MLQSLSAKSLSSSHLQVALQNYTRHCTAPETSATALRCKHPASPAGAKAQILQKAWNIEHTLMGSTWRFWDSLLAFLIATTRSLAGAIYTSMDLLRGRSSKILKSIKHRGHRRRNMATVGTEGWKSPRISVSPWYSWIFHRQQGRWLFKVTVRASVTSLTSLLPRSHSWKHGSMEGSEHQTVEALRAVTALQSKQLLGHHRCQVARPWQSHVNELINVSLYQSFVGSDISYPRKINNSCSSTYPL